MKYYYPKKTTGPCLGILLFNFLLFILTFVFSFQSVAQTGCIANIENNSAEICLNAGTAKTFSNSIASGGIINWLSSGDGSFDNNSLQKPTYTPGPNDIANGFVYIYLDVYKDDSITPCSALPITTLLLSTLKITATPVSQTTCSGSGTTRITLSGGPSPLIYNWTRDNTTLVTGMAASGSGNIISGNLTNASNAPLTVTYTIIPNTNGCTVTPVTATVLVYPRQVVTRTPVSQTVCSGTPITTISFSSGVSGTVFNWTRSAIDSATGIAASGSGNISGALTNTTAVPVTVTFTITPTANGCSGTPFTATALVNPAPNVMATPLLQTICSDATITPVALSGSMSGAIYNWSRNNMAAVTGIAASGSGNISGALSNITTAPVTVTFTVTPAFNSCLGTPVLVTALVNPKPNAVTTPSSQVICSGATMAPITISGGVSGATYNWTRDNIASVTGIAASGSGNISGALTNITTAPVTVTFTIIPSANGCTGTTIFATVTIFPRTSSFISGDQAICGGTTPSNISIVLTGTSPWNFTYTNGTTPVTVTGNTINPYVFTPPASPAIYTVTSLNDANCVAQSVDRTGSATISQQSYAIISSAGANGSISANGTTLVNCGTDQTYTITPNAGSNIQDVVADGISKGPINSYTFTNVRETHTISATFTGISGCTSPTVSGSVQNVLCNMGSSGSITLTASGGTAPFSYAWTGPNGFTAITKDITGLFAGSYNIVVTATGSCSTLNTITVTEPTALTATVAAVPVQCSATKAILTVTAAGGTGALKYSLNGGTFQSGNTFTVNASASPYSVSVRDANFCITTTNSVTVSQQVTIPGKPTAVTGQVYGLCGGGTFTYGVQAVESATGYTWTAPTGCTISSGQGTSQILLRIPSTFRGPGTVGVSATNGCGTGTKYTFSIYAVLYYPDSSIAGPSSVTSGQTNLQYSLPYTSGLTYTWTVPTGARITSGQGTYMIKVKFGTRSGNVSVKVKNTCGTSAAANKMVTVGAARIASVNSPLKTNLVATNRIAIQEITFVVYPNPAQTNVTVNFNAIKAGDKFEVLLTNLIGETLDAKSGVTFAGQNTLQFNLNKLNNGMYLVRLITKDNIQIQKLLKGQ